MAREPIGRGAPGLEQPLRRDQGSRARWQRHTLWCHRQSGSQVCDQSSTSRARGLRRCRRFLREIRYAWFVMPFVSGETLRQVLRRERMLPIERAARAATDVLDALGHAHAHGFAHRDGRIRPAGDGLREPLRSRAAPRTRWVRSRSPRTPASCRHRDARRCGSASSTFLD